MGGTREPVAYQVYEGKEKELEKLFKPGGKEVETTLLPNPINTPATFSSQNWLRVFIIPLNQ